MLLIFLMVIGGLTCVAARVWSWVLAGRESVWWLLACIFVPFAGIVFLVKFWAEAKRPFFLNLAGFGVLAAAFLLTWRALPEAQRSLVLTSALAGARGGDAPPTAARDPRTAAATPSTGLQRETAAAAAAELLLIQRLEKQKALAQHRAEADAMFKDLSARRAKLKPGDKNGTAAFNADAARYQNLLAQIKTEKTELDALSPQAPTSSPTALANNAGTPPAASPPITARR